MRVFRRTTWNSSVVKSLEKLSKPTNSLRSGSYHGERP